MEWYQLMYRKPNSDFYHTYGGRHNPYKLSNRDDAFTAETTLMQRFPGCEVLTVKVTEVLFSDLDTRNTNRLKEYVAILN